MDISSEKMQEQSISETEILVTVDELKKSICNMQYEIHLLENIVEILNQYKI